MFTVNVDRDFDFLPFNWTIGAGHDSDRRLHLEHAEGALQLEPEPARLRRAARSDLGGYYNGDKQTYTASLNFIPRQRLLVENSYTRNRFTLPGAPPYATNTLSTRVSYSFSPALFVKGFVQYNDDRRLATLNLLFWYIYRPGSDLYVVYNNGWETDVPGSTPRILRVRNRSLAVKMTYWLSR